METSDSRADAWGLDDLRTSRGLAPVCPDRLRLSRSEDAPAGTADGNEVQQDPDDRASPAVQQRSTAAGPLFGDP
jgi:hypothetical protein